MNEHENQMKCLSFQEPYATLITLGLKTVECRSRNIQTPIKDLVVCASKTASIYYPIDGLAYGYAIGLVDVIGCEPFTDAHCVAAMMSQMPEKKCNAWMLKNARLIKPFPVSATASFFYVDDKPEVIPTTIESYLEYYPAVVINENGNAADNVSTLFCDSVETVWKTFAL